MDFPCGLCLFFAHRYLRSKYKCAYEPEVLVGSFLFFLFVYVSFFFFSSYLRRNKSRCVCVLSRVFFYCFLFASLFFARFFTSLFRCPKNSSPI